MAARACIGHHGAGIFHAIGAFEDCGQGQSFDRLGLRVAGKGGRKNGFPGPVSPPVCGQEHIDRRGGLAAFDAPVREVKLGVGERQEGQIARAIPSHQHRRRRRALAARQPCVKAGIAHGIGLGRSKDFIGA